MPLRSAKPARGPRRARLALAACAATLIAGVGCTGGSDQRTGRCPAEAPPAIPVGDAPATNNSATLEGPRVGSRLYGDDDACVLRRSVLVTVTRAAEGMAVNGHAFVLRASALLSGVITALVPMSNTSSSDFCSWDSIDITLRDQAGDVMVSERTNLIGSVALRSALGTLDCLAPGETGFLETGAIDLTRSLFDQVAAVEVSVIALFPAASRPSSSLVPRSYAVDGDAVTITFQNVGTSTVRTGGLLRAQHVMLLDDDGLPVDWSTFDYGSDEVTIQPGQTGTVTHATLSASFPGSVTRLRPFLEFD